MEGLDDVRDAFFDLSPDLLCIVGLDRYIKEANPAWERILGWSVKELKARPVLGFIHPDDRETTAAFLASLGDGDTISGFENRVLVKGGGLRWIAWTGHVHGDVLLAVGRDVTAAHAARERVELMRDHTARIAGAPDLRTGLGRLLDAVLSLTGWDVAEAWADLGGDGVLHPVVARGRDDAGIARFLQAGQGLGLVPGEGVPGVALGEGAPVWLADLPRDPRFRRQEAAADADLRTGLAVPLMEGDDVIAGLLLASRGRVEEDAELVAVVAGLAHQAASILHRHRATLEFAASEKRYRSVVETAEDAVILADARGAVIGWNPAAEDLFGHAADDALGMKLVDLMPPEYRDRHLQGMARYLATGETWIMGRPIEVEALHASGERVPVELTVSSWTDVGEPRFTGIMRDIRARKAAEAEGARLRRQLEDAQALAGIGSWTWNATRDTIEWSDELYRMFGLEPQGVDITYDLFLAHVHPDDAPLVREAVETALDTGDPYDIEHRILRPGGEVRWIHGRGTVTRRGGDTILQGTTQDITDRHDAAEVVERSHALVANVLSSITDAFVALDKEWRYTLVNERMARLVGEPDALEVLRGRVLWDVYPELKGTPQEAELRRAMGERVPVSYEEYDDERDRWWEVRAYPFQDGLSVFFHDITDTKRATAALEHEARQQAALHNLLRVAQETTSPPDLLDRIAETTATALSTGRCAIILEDDGVLRVVATYDAEGIGTDAFGGVEITPETMPAAHAAIREAMRTREVRHVQAVEGGIAEAGMLDRLRQVRVFRGSNYAPLVVEGESVGVLAIADSRAAEPLQDAERALLTRLAQYASLAMERARLTERLRASEERYRSLYENAPVAYLNVDEDGSILSANREAAHLFGLPVEDLVGRRAREFAALTPGGAERVAELRERVEREGALEDEVEIQRSNGERRWVSFRYTRRDVDGRREGAVTIVDVTERHRAEEALQREERRVRLLMEAAMAANAAPALESAAAHTVDAFCRLADWSIGHAYLLDERAHVLVPSGRWSARDGEFADFRRITEATRFGPGEGLPGRVLASRRPEWVPDLAADDSFPRRTLLTDLKLSTGFAFPVLVGEEVVAVLEFYRREPTDVDPTLLDVATNLGAQLGRVVERLRAREALEEAARELARSNEELEQFAHIASHDLQAPLRHVRGFADLLERHLGDAIDENGKRLLTTIHGGVEEMQEMIDSLLAYSRVTTRAQPLEPLDLEPVLARVLETLSPEIEATDAKVTHDAMPSVLGDETQMRQVFQNLLQNAIKFRRPDAPPRIHVGVEREDEDTWRVSVADNGIGIEARHHDRVFRMFHRLQPRGAVEGTGIGLTLVKRIVERHGGEIHLASAPGEGTTISFTLPSVEEG